MTFREAMTRQPKDLDHRHTAVAQLLMGWPQGVTRSEATRRLGMHDRAFRQAVEDITASGWLPIVPDRSNGGEAKYRIAGPTEVELVSNASQEDHSRAVSLHKRSKGRLEAFRAHHTAGSLFVPDVAELEES